MFPSCAQRVILLESPAGDNSRRYGCRSERCVSSRSRSTSALAENDARLVIDAWRQSGRTMTAFARAHDIHLERLARWRRLLSPKPHAAVRFHPVRVRALE
jgi:hypothetical protein